MVLDVENSDEFLRSGQVQAYSSLCSSEVCSAKGLLKLYGQILNIDHNILTDINCNMQQHPNMPIQIIGSACALHKRTIDFPFK